MNHGLNGLNELFHRMQILTDSYRFNGPTAMNNEESFCFSVLRANWCPSRNRR